jgi:hypothetical protein
VLGNGAKMMKKSVTVQGCESLLRFKNPWSIPLAGKEAEKLQVCPGMSQ